MARTSNDEEGEDDPLLFLLLMELEASERACWSSESQKIQSVKIAFPFLQSKSDRVVGSLFYYY